MVQWTRIYYNFRRLEFEQPTLVKKCECPCFHPKKQDLIKGDGDDYGWSRIGPMGALLDPKLYVVKVGRSPESNIMRREQPNRFLVKVNKSCHLVLDTI